MFSQVSVCPQGLPRSVVPGSFLGVPFFSGPWTFPEWYPNQAFSPGVPWTGQRVPPDKTGVPNSPDRIGVLPDRTRVLQTGQVVPQTGQAIPQTGQRGTHAPRKDMGTACSRTGYIAGGTPLAVTQEDFLVLFYFRKIRLSTHFTTNKTCSNVKKDTRNFQHTGTFSCLRWATFCFILYYINFRGRNYVPSKYLLYLFFDWLIDRLIGWGGIYGPVTSPVKSPVQGTVAGRWGRGTTGQDRGTPSHQPG